MTTAGPAVEATIAHGGTRRGDYLECTPHEYHDLERLRALERRLVALIDRQQKVSPYSLIRLDELRRTVDGPA